MEERRNALRIRVVSDRTPFPVLMAAHLNSPIPTGLEHGACSNLSATGRVLRLSENVTVRLSSRRLSNVCVVPVFQPRSSVANDITPGLARDEDTHQFIP
jgi:hypothetical protein